MSEQITFFDLESKPPRACWSYNPWKTRLLLNFKGLDYKTEWMIYPDLEPTFEPHVPANDRGRAYTIPVVKFPDGQYVMDSRKIATAIQQRYPEPPIHLDSPYLPKIEAIFDRAFAPLKPIIYHAVLDHILTEPSVDIWSRVRTEQAGMPLDEFYETQGGEAAWSAAEPGLHEATALLKENGDGPFFMGQTVSYADFVWAGLLAFARKWGDEEFGELLRRTGDGEAHLKLLEGLAPWLERDDH